MSATKQDIIAQLRRDILLLEGFKAPTADAIDIGLGPVAAAFPNGVFPTGAIHEFISNGPETAAATGGFVAGLTGGLMCSGGTCIWVSTRGKVFAPGLKAFDVEPDRVIFVDVRGEKDALWVMEEALKCEGIAVVVGEIPEISFTASRRLQLAVEQSRVTGLLLRNNPRKQNTIACVARWKIGPVASKLIAGMPGVGFPCWNVELEKVRNGRPGTWQVEWSAGRFQHLVLARPALSQEGLRKTG